MLQLQNEGNSAGQNGPVSPRHTWHEKDTEEETEETKQPSAKCGLSLDPDLSKPTEKDILRQLETIEHRWGIR